MRLTASAEMSMASASGQCRASLRTVPALCEREFAVITEAVEQPPAPIACCGVAVLPLVEKQPRLLPFPQIYVVFDGALARNHRLRDAPVEHPHCLVEPFEQPN